MRLRSGSLFGDVERFGRCLWRSLRSGRRWGSSFKGIDDSIFTEEDHEAVRFESGFLSEGNDPRLELNRRVQKSEGETSRGDETLEFSARIEQFDDKLSRLTHRPLNVFLRPRMVDRVADFEALLRNKSIPGVIQGAGVIMTVGVPYEPILRDFETGWFCSRHDDEKVQTLFCGPVYDLRVYSDLTGGSLEFRERAYASVLLFSPDSHMPISLRFLRVALEHDFEQRVPIHTYNEFRCPGLINGGKLVKLNHGVTVLVPPDVLPPRILWINLDRTKLDTTLYAHHLERPQGSEFVRWIDLPTKPLYKITAMR